jgi:hypothetical protein
MYFQHCLDDLQSFLEEKLSEFLRGAPVKVEIQTDSNLPA